METAVRKYINVARGDIFAGKDAVSMGLNCMLVTSDSTVSMVTRAEPDDRNAGCGFVEAAADAKEMVDGS